MSLADPPGASASGNGRESSPAVSAAQDQHSVPAAATISTSWGGVWEALERRLNRADYRPARSPAVTAVPMKTRHGESYYILANRDRSKYLRLSPEDFHIWRLMDGTRTVKDLIYEYFTEFGILAFDLVAHLVARLRRDFMLLDPPRDIFASVQRTLAKRSRMAWPRTVWQVITGERTFEIHGIDGFMAAVHRRAAWVLYTTPLQVLYVAVCLVGGALFVRIFASGRYDLFQTAGSYGIGLVLLMGLNFLCVVVHEASHALTCKHYGGQVHSAGLMLYFGMPAAFVDTTDIWTKAASARIATTWAGPYSGAIFAGAAAIVVQALPYSWVAPILHRLSFLWLENLLFNVIPFLELDGYYLAVDWLEMPLLRERALAFVRRDLWDRLRHRQPLTGRERLLTRFGGLSLVFSGLVLVSAALAWEYGRQDLGR